MDYIYTFVPQLKLTIWGGEKIKSLKNIDTQLNHIGESWEVSGVEGNETIVADGQHNGRTLNSLVAEFKGDFVGQETYERFGDEFPLLIKFIDAAQDLSIQVHPSDELAPRHGHPKGKTEMWFVMDSDPQAKLRCGLKAKISPEEYKQMVADNTICDAISEYSVKEGDCFYIPAGRIHSIGKGCLLAEIQETSDVTYRIYDFMRRDKNGNLRQLHTHEASEAIDYSVSEDYHTDYRHIQNEPVQLVSCPHFTTALYDLTEPMTLDYSELDSFVILICTKGEGTITNEVGKALPFHAGTVVLLPAWTNAATVEGNVKFLETYV